LAVVLACDAVFVVDGPQAVLVLRSGAPVRTLNPDGRSAGLYAKWPLIEQVVRLDRRVLALDGPPQEVTTADGGRVSVQATLRYRVVDPVRFYAAAGGVSAGAPGLQRALASGVAAALTGLTSQELARVDAHADAAAKRSREVAVEARLGVEPVEVVFTALSPADPEAAGRRMQAQEAAKVQAIRADSEGNKRELLAQADREAADIRGEGEHQALVVRGQGDAERAAILGAAYGKDPAFARDFRRLEAYDQALNPQTTTLVLSPEGNDFLNLFAHGARNDPPKTR
jgi:modulator of FtsH protease HflC